MVGINLGWLLFDGFSRKAQISKQKYLAKSYQYLAEDMKTMIPVQIQNALLNLDNIRARIEVGYKALRVAEKSMAIAQTRLDIGDISMIDFLEAENQLAQAEFELLQFRYENLPVQLQYKAAAGFYPEVEFLE
jgi:outer membrane protein